MDPYEKIREQLEKAQQRSVDALTNRINVINESLAKLVEEAQHAISEAAPADPGELLPLGELTGLIDAAHGLQAEAEERAVALERRIDELERQLEAAQSEAKKPAGLPLDVLRRLDAARSQSELLKELLPLLTAYAGRAAVLVIREGTVSAWSGIGFANAENLKTWRTDVSASEVLDRFVSLGGVVTFAPAADPTFSQWLSGEAQPSEAWLIPVNLRGRIVGAMYIDRLEDGPWDPETAQGLVALACWLIDTLSFRTTVPSPTLAEPVAAGPQSMEEAAPSAMEETPATGYPPVTVTGTPAEAAEEPAVEETAPQEAVSSMESAAEPEAAGVEAVETAGEAPSGYEEGTVSAEVPAAPEAAEYPRETPAEEEAVEEAVEAEAAPVEAEAAPVEEAGEVTEMPAAEVTMPPEVQPVVPPSAETTQAEAMTGEPEELSPEDRAAHEEAERFARLLVSEIKLYNPEEVEHGKAAKDLYQRLKEDIDRSREMYENRISESVRSSRDYFREQLVRILADGDEEALGM